MATCNHTAFIRRGIIKMAYRGLAVAIALTCAACGGGGGGGESPAPAPAPTSPPQKTPIVFMLRGDSTDAGACSQTNDPHCINGRTSPTPAQLMQQDFDSLFGAGKVMVVDAAAGGSKLQDDLNGTAPYVVPLATSLAGSDADIVATNSEINDLFSTETPDQYAVYLQQYIQTVHAAGKLPVLLEPNPVCANTASITPYTQQQFLAQMRSIAAAQSITLAMTFDAFSQVGPTPIGSDCIHPTYTGYVFKESQYIKTLQPLLQGMLVARGLL